MERPLGTPKIAPDSSSPNILEGSAPSQSLRTASLLLPCTPLFNAFTNALCEKVAGNDMKIESAQNMSRILRRFLRFTVGSGYETLEAPAIESQVLDTPGQKIEDFLAHLSSEKASKQSIAAARSTLFQFYRLASENGFTSFSTTDVGHLIPQIGTVPMPAVIIEWGKAERSAGGSEHQNSNSKMSLIRHYVKFVCDGVLPAKNPDLNLKGELRAYRSIRESRSPPPPQFVSEAPKLTSVTGHLLRGAHYWIVQYKEYLINSGASPDKLKHEWWAIRAFYRWAQEQTLTSFQPDGDTSPLRNRQIAKSRRDPTARPTPTSKIDRPHEKVINPPEVTPLMSPTTDDLADVVVGSVETQTTLTADQVKRIIPAANTLLSLALRDEQFAFSKLRFAEWAAFDSYASVLTIDEQSHKLSPELSTLLTNFCVLFESAEPRTAPTSLSTELIFRVADGPLFANELIDASDNNGRAFVRMRDLLICQLLNNFNVDLYSLCSLTSRAIATIKNRTQDEALLKTLRLYQQAGNTVLKGSPFSSSVNEIPLLLTLDELPLIREGIIET